MFRRRSTPEKPLPVYNLKQLASCKGVLGIYAGAGERIHEDGPGIAHAASWAYKELGTKRCSTPDSSVRPPLVFKDKFLPLMKALLVSRVIAKAPLGNANDIRGLSQGEGRVREEGIRERGSHEAV